jgi:NADPH:quinone reductase-like Zn-dependent oxidoreductase
MKKIIYNHYGDADELTLIETGIPEITPTTLLVKIKAASLNPLDWKILAGEMKLFARSGFPRGVGIDFSGIVEETGSTISKFKKGDAVFGSVDQFKGGALSEYVLVSEKDIAIKPAGISFEKAAAIPVVGFAALQMVDQLITIRQGTELLVNGATGGIGMFLVQIAKSKGAAVTAIVSKNGKALAEKWGSDHVIDYREENVLENKKQYDVVVDLSGKMPFAKAKRIMKPSSVYVNTVPGPRQIIASLLHNLFSKKKYKVLLSKPSVSDLKTLADYVSGGMEVVIGKRYEITSFKEAYTEVPAHGVLGKAVICMPD